LFEPENAGTQLSHLFFETMRISWLHCPTLYNE
jgi:hypothetical protein